MYHKKQEGWRREEPDAHGEVSNVHLFLLEPDNVNVHRAAAKIIVFKSRAARGSVCIVLLCGHVNRDLS